MTVEVRLLAFVKGPQTPSVVLALILGFIVVFCIILIFIAIFFFCRGRYSQLDSAGATIIGGPKMNFRETQPNVTDPELKTRPKIILPTRDAGDLASRYAAILNDPKTPKGAIILDENGTVIRGIRSLPRSAFPDQRPSPPAPGCGANEELQESRIPAAHTGSSVRRRRTLIDDDDIRLETTPPSFSPYRGDVLGNDNKENDVSGVLISREKQSVKYIPQWMSGSFGRGGTIPQPGGDEAPHISQGVQHSTGLRSALKKPILMGSPALPKQEENGFQQYYPIDKGIREVGMPPNRDYRDSRGIDDNLRNNGFQRGDTKLSGNRIFSFDTGTYENAGGILTPGRTGRGGPVTDSHMGTPNRHGRTHSGGIPVRLCGDCGTTLGTTNNPVYCVVTGKRHF